ncbi:hypothetical protein [uncultured Paracoccus sp.]|uniref:hypothetical protein n=1 Tax=uncultured Paracoccus sp. TaxID=189685 RepID=UPI002608B4C9|nr:hypothetical protein [uncultured Paracoccus sp.]
MGEHLHMTGDKTMAKHMTASPRTDRLADEAIDQMFGYYSRETQFLLRAANDGNRVISELDAAGAILAAKRAA